jgi:hypothetical protein
MAGPYDYTVNIPQPPAQNFLQSLMGIRQLQQMEEQSAIQQQNAAFQQKMQPLQIEAERARIGQIGQATAASAEALRQGRLTFEQAQAERSLKTKYQNDVLELSKNPEAWTPEKLKSLSMQASVLDPQSFSAMNRMFAELPRVGSTLSNAASEVMLSVQAGKPEIASASLDKYISAANASLESNPNDKAAQASLVFLESAKTQIEQDPAAGALSASNFLFNTDPQKWDAVSKAMKGAAELAETEAKTKKELVLATATKQEKQVDEEKRALDLEKERLQIQEIRQKLDQAREEKVKVFASTNKFAKELSDASATNQQSADIAKGILEKIDSGEVQIPSTVKGAAWQYVRDRIPLLGNDVTMLRKEYQKLANSEVIKSLPPGSASDADRRFAQEGVMSKNASPEQFRKGVEAMARLSEYASKYNEAKLAWVSENNGSAGNSMKELQIFGSPIKKGTAFHAWFNKVGNTLDQNAMSPQASPAAVGGNPTDVDSILKRFGVPQ